MIDKILLKDINTYNQIVEVTGLSNVNFFFGRNGSGKSTLANLITRFWDVKSGQILIDGIDIKHIKLHDYRLLFGLVTQDSILLDRKSVV